MLNQYMKNTWDHSMRYHIFEISYFYYLSVMLWKHVSDCVGLGTILMELKLSPQAYMYIFINFSLVCWLNNS